MITMTELLKDKNLNEYHLDIRHNLEDLLEKVNKVRTAYGKAMIPTSCMRSREDQIRIYAEKGITDESKIPMKSKHFYGQAVDISDPHQELQDWCENNIDVLEEIGLWMEDFTSTKNWVHFQTVAPASGKRFFKP